LSSRTWRSWIVVVVASTDSSSSFLSATLLQDPQSKKNCTERQRELEPRYCKHYQTMQTLDMQTSLNMIWFKLSCESSKFSMWNELCQWSKNLRQFKLVFSKTNSTTMNETKLLFLSHSIHECSNSCSLLMNESSNLVAQQNFFKAEWIPMIRTIKLSPTHSFCRIMTILLNHTNVVNY